MLIYMLDNHNHAAGICPAATCTYDTSLAPINSAISISSDHDTSLTPINSAISISSDHDTSLTPINSISSKYM